MPGISGMIVKEEEMVYYIISKTALGGYIPGDVEKEYLLNLLKTEFCYLVEVFAFCIMGNHFHLLIRINNHENYSGNELKERPELYYYLNLTIRSGLHRLFYFS